MPPAPDAAPRVSWVLCGLLFAATALSFMDRQVLSVLAPAMTADLRISDTEYGRVVSAFVLAYTIMFAAGGWLVDRVGTIRGLAVAVAVWSVASACHALATGAATLAASRFLLGLGEGACVPAAAKGTTEWFPPRQRGMATGIAVGGAAFGSLVAPPATAWIAGLCGWRGAFVATGIAGGIWLAAWLAAGSFAPPSRAGGGARSLSSILRHPATWRLLAARFVFDPLIYFYMFWVPKYLAADRGLKTAEIGGSFWIPFLALGLCNIASGRLADRLLDRGWSARAVRRAMLTGAALVTPVSCLVLRAPSVGWAIALMTLVLAAHGFWISTYMTLIGDLFPSRVVATVVGLTGMVGGMAGVLANLVTGPVVERHGFVVPFAVAAILYPVALAILLTIPPSAEPADAA